VQYYCNRLIRLSHKKHGDDVDYVTPSQLTFHEMLAHGGISLIPLRVVATHCFWIAESARADRGLHKRRPWHDANVMQEPKRVPVLNARSERATSFGALCTIPRYRLGNYQRDQRGIHANG
jgi:hypothetical protein